MQQRSPASVSPSARATSHSAGKHADQPTGAARARRKAAAAKAEEQATGNPPAEAVEATLPQRQERPKRGPQGSGPVAAIIIDDVGYSLEALKPFLAVDAPLTFSVLPDRPRTSELVRELTRDGRCVMVHLPMEPLSKRTDLEPATIRVGMSRRDIQKAVAKALQAVPGACGVNNHMGSRATADRDVVEAVMEVVRDHGLFFVDSVTGSHSKIPQVARAMGVPVARRDVFLDADSPPSADTVAKRMAELGGVAVRNGAAIGIGHVRPATADGIRNGLSALQKRGVRLVPAADLF